ncbi:microtubule-associated protein 70-2-like protein [Tanacetum coccineum]|uniref:Microtubule-associated protein 70-2-like protein n=1 Tax=Tanacetum coccineum TaxID=301880 RepID=A0ABQ4YXX4_9ASTR
MLATSNLSLSTARHLDSSKYCASFLHIFPRLHDLGVLDPNHAHRQKRDVKVPLTTFRDGERVAKEENIRLERMNRHKVSEVQKLVQTVCEREEVVLAGGAAAIAKRDY